MYKILLISICLIFASRCDDNFEKVNTKDLIGVAKENGLEYAMDLAGWMPICNIDSETGLTLYNMSTKNNKRLRWLLDLEYNIHHIQSDREALSSYEVQSGPNIIELDNEYMNMGEIDFFKEPKLFDLIKNQLNEHTKILFLHATVKAYLQIVYSVPYKSLAYSKRVILLKLNKNNQITAYTVYHVMS